jgi:hypothetical protein
LTRSRTNDESFLSSINFVCEPIKGLHEDPSIYCSTAKGKVNVRNNVRKSPPHKAEGELTRARQ